MEGGAQLHMAAEAGLFTEFRSLAAWGLGGDWVSRDVEWSSGVGMGIGCRGNEERD